MQYSCYLEVNVISLILLGIIYFRLHQQRTMMSSAQSAMKRMLAATAVLCISDMIAIVSRGRFFPFALPVIEGSNLIYLEMMPVISMFWCDYACIRLGQQCTLRRTWLYRLPIALFTLVALTNPLHHLLFSIGPDHLYVRGPGVLIHWVISWLYFILSGAEAYKAIRATANWAQRTEYKPLLYFLILPAIGCLTQMLLYGVTTVQAGIVLSLILVSMQMQDNQISTDELTGINNRKAMRHYLDNLLYSSEPVAMSVMMIDVNRFKQINDTYGHNVGDVALQDTANMLKSVCSQSHEHLFLCRYGGDEFVIIFTDAAQTVVDAMADKVRSTAAAYADQLRRPFALSLSVGCASGLCSSYEDFLHYLRLADESMYDEKKNSR